MRYWCCDFCEKEFKGVRPNTSSVSFAKWRFDMCGPCRSIWKRNISKVSVLKALRPLFRKGVTRGKRNHK